MNIKLLLVPALLFFLVSPFAAHAASTDNLTGYAWSSNIGWVSFNCTNDNSCGTNSYGVTVAADGTMSGYAWSPNVGWISFNSADTTGCPSGTCQATFTKSSGQVTGWARAVAGTDTNPADTGGWGGWISLSGTNYNVSSSGCKWGGYAWGGGPDSSTGVIGWLHFSGTGYSVTGTSVNSCVGTPVPPLTAACSVSPTSNVATNQSVTWSSTPTGGTAPYTYTWGGSVVGSTQNVTMSYPSTGSYTGQVTVKSSDGQTVTANCSPGGAGNPLVVTSCAPTFSPSATTVVQGQTVTFTWASPASCNLSCSGAGFTATGGTGNGTSPAVTPTAPSSTYSLMCSGQPNQNATVNVTVPSVTLTATPVRVTAPTAPNTVSLTWTSSLLTDPSNKCTVTGNGNGGSWGVNEPSTSPSPLVDPTPIKTQTTYTITCTTGTASSKGKTVSSTATVNVVPQFSNF